MKRRTFLSAGVSSVAMAYSLYPNRLSKLLNPLNKPPLIKNENDLSILLLSSDSAIKKAGEWLHDEIVQRTGFSIPIVNEQNVKENSKYQIVLGLKKNYPKSKTLLLPQLEKDEFQIVKSQKKIMIIAVNVSGVLSGVGRFLLKNRFDKGKIELLTTNLNSEPKNSIRGHLLAHRPNSTCYYWWDLDAWEKYIRYLLLWGVNTVGIVPGNFSSSATDGIDPWNIPAGSSAGKIAAAKRYWSITAEVADLIHKYGLNIEGWVVANDVFNSDYKKEYDMGGGNLLCPNLKGARELILKLHQEAYDSIPYLDTLFIAGGDPGGCPCHMCTPWAKTFLPLSKDIAQIYRESHPKGKVWISPQFYDQKESYKFFFDYIKTEKPNWLNAVAYGPNSAVTIKELRAKLDKNYPIVLYPDINHVMSCQYPVKPFDMRFKVIYSREPPNYRPGDMASIHKSTSPYSIGSSTYSEGVHDDLNKAVWSSLDWNPKVKVSEVVADYSRWFFGEINTKRITKAIYGLEKNWEIPMVGNNNISATLNRLEKAAKLRPEIKDNWRYQMALVRAQIDRYIQIKREHEIDVEKHVAEILESDKSITNIKTAAGYVTSEINKPLAVDLRKSIEVLRNRLEVGTPTGNGLHLTFYWRIDVKIGNIWWLEHQLKLADKITDDQQRAKAVHDIIHYEDPGEGGFYDEAGDPANEPHLVSGYSPEVLRDKPEWPVWIRFSQLTVVGDDKLVLFSYDELNPDVNYKVKVTYFSTRRFKGSVELYAADKNTGNEYKIHDSIPLPLNKAEQYTFQIPKKAYTKGAMELRFKKGKTGEATAVSEVWIMKV